MPARDEQADVRKLLERIMPSLTPAEAGLLRGLLDAAAHVKTSAEIAADTMAALQREISSRLLVLAETDPLAAAQLLAKVKGRIEAVGQLVLDFGAGGQVAARPNRTDDLALIEVLNSRTVRTLRRDHTIFQLFKVRTNQNLMEAHVILDHVRRIEPGLKPNTLTKHLASLSAFGLLKSDQKGQWSVTRLGEAYRELVPGQLQALGADVPQI